MSQKHQLLLNAVFHQLSRAPSCPLGDLSRELCVSRRTIEIAVSITTGKTFRDVREQRSEEHTSELQSRLHLVCRLLLEKKKERAYSPPRSHTALSASAVGAA